jgi:D-alanyl-D-alanine dipeptidase
MHPKDPSSQIQDEINPMHTKSMLGKTYFFKTPFAALRLKKSGHNSGRQSVLPLLWGCFLMIAMYCAKDSPSPRDWWFIIALALVLTNQSIARLSAAEPHVDKSDRPPTFVRLDQHIPDLCLDLQYGTTNNFTGQVVRGYERPVCWITRPAAEALEAVQQRLRPMGLSLMVFDAFRPQKAVDFFVTWSQANNDPEWIKETFFPRLEKAKLFTQGYISKRSGHTRGSTVDLTLCSRASGAMPMPLDMGTRFDFFGEEASTLYPELTAQQRANRLLLKHLMESQGFKAYAVEWWHFTLIDEPFPDRYFDFPLSP